MPPWYTNNACWSSLKIRTNRNLFCLVALLSLMAAKLSSAKSRVCLAKRWVSKPPPICMYLQLANIHRKRRTEPIQRRWKFESHCCLPVEQPASIYTSLLLLCSAEGQHRATMSTHKYCHPWLTINWISDTTMRQSPNALCLIFLFLTKWNCTTPTKYLFTFARMRGMIHTIVLMFNNGTDEIRVWTLDSSLRCQMLFTARLVQSAVLP